MARGILNTPIFNLIRFSIAIVLNIVNIDQTDLSLNLE